MLKSKEGRDEKRRREWEKGEREGAVNSEGGNSEKEESSGM